MAHPHHFNNHFGNPPPPPFYGSSGGSLGPPNPRKRRFDDGGGGGGRGRPQQPYQSYAPNNYPIQHGHGRGGSGRGGGHSHSSQHPRSDTNLIINYLPQTLSDEELRDLFIQFGDLENCRIMRDKNTGYSFGYGFVNFTTAEAATMAIEGLNGHHLQNKTIKVSLARPPSTEIKDTNLYITNLPRDMTEEQLVNMFSQYGHIVQKNILYDKYTQLPRGVAFVRYDLREQANAAIQAMNDYIPPGASEPIKVRLAENHGRQKASYVAGFQAGYSTNSRGGGPGGRF